MRIACTTWTPTGMSNGNNTISKIRMCGMYDTFLGLPVRQPVSEEISAPVGVLLRRRAPNSWREVVVRRQDRNIRADDLGPAGATGDGRDRVIGGADDPHRTVVAENVKKGLVGAEDQALGVGADGYAPRRRSRPSRSRSDQWRRRRDWWRCARLRRTHPGAYREVPLYGHAPTMPFHVRVVFDAGS